MKLKKIFVVAIIFIVSLMIGCASQRTRATCAETEYRLNSMSYSPDQRAFLEEELRQCRAEQAEQEKDDVITNKVVGSIRDRFAADSAAKAKEKAETVEAPSEVVEGVSENASVATEESSEVSETPESETVEDATEESAGN